MKVYHSKRNKSATRARNVYAKCLHEKYPKKAKNPYCICKSSLHNVIRIFLEFEYFSILSHILTGSNGCICTV